MLIRMMMYQTPLIMLLSLMLYMKKKKALFFWGQQVDLSGNNFTFTAVLSGHCFISQGQQTISK
jgi:hypothetical protein